MYGQSESTNQITIAQFVQGWKMSFDIPITP